MLRWAVYEARKTHARAAAGHAYYATVKDHKNTAPSPWRFRALTVSRPPSPSTTSRSGRPTLTADGGVVVDSANRTAPLQAPPSRSGTLTASGQAAAPGAARHIDLFCRAFAIKLYELQVARSGGYSRRARKG